MRSFFLLSAALMTMSCTTANDNLVKTSSLKPEAQIVETTNTNTSSTSNSLKDGEVLTEKNKKKKSSKRVCKYDSTVTSRIKRKTCRTQAEWDYIEQETQREVNRLKRRNPNQGRGGATLPGGI